MLWLTESVCDKGIEFHLDNPRVLTYGCGNVLLELFKYTFDIPNERFTTIIHRNLHDTKVILPPKTDEENFKDIWYTVKSYQQLPAVFLSTNLIECRNYQRFDLIAQYVKSCGDTLEYYLLNKQEKISKSYKDGKIEFNLLRLIQEMFALAVKGNQCCTWMLAFNSPYQIWFIALAQLTYLLFVERPISKQEYYRQTQKLIKNSIPSIQKSEQWLDLITALQITVDKLKSDHTPPIGTFYYQYLQSINQQARTFLKSSEYRLL